MINESRRRFLTRISVGFTGLIVAVVGIPIVGYLLGPLIRPVTNQWRTVGRVTDWKVGDTRLVQIENPTPLPWAGTTAQTAAWVRRRGENEWVAFSVHCTHLGCPVNWLADANLFMCPCHGGVYYEDGTVAAGPPPRPLYRPDVRIVSGEVQVKTIILPVQYGPLG